jgi:hypothetical protein
MKEDEKCCMCDKEADTFSQDGQNYCVECWQEMTAHIPGKFYN